ncbi:CRISPR-associated helicase Cas3' [Clostridium intestinale]|uniref:CRISPR-associated helicase Cas3' n=1 Tax=Clostridium intestinale TaxID=36845 RepID=UPI0028E2098C|nr:CRISPR-associated helicase Cas3' [Clostridium intestinale]
MYFDNVDLFKIEESVSNLDKFYAHTRKDGDREKLKEHMDLVYSYFLKVVKVKNLDDVFLNLEQSFFKESESSRVKLWKEMICNAVYLHDLGKININFQRLKMDNKILKISEKTDDYKHSMLSSILYFNHYIREVFKVKGEDGKLLLVFLYINSYVISKHHGQLAEFDEFKDELLRSLKNYLEEKEEIFPDFIPKLSINPKLLESRFNRDLNTYLDKFSKTLGIELYIYSKLLSSLLTTSDFYATSEYENQKEISCFGTLENSKEYYEIYKASEKYKNIQRHRGYLNGIGEKVFKDTDINRLRSEMFIEAEDNITKNIDKNIFYLEAPTGSGKTMTSVNLAFKLLEKDKKLNKIFYIFPFNTLVEQTNKSLEEIFIEEPRFKESISIINSVTPIKTIDENEDNKNVKVEGLKRTIDYESSLLSRQFVHYPIILTTHVNFFSYLFGTSREDGFPLTHLANSVVIIDEIQSYRNILWKEIITFLESYSKLLNIKIIIMSATLPRLEDIGKGEQRCSYLIENRDKYYNSKLFKDRVKLDFSLLDVKEDIQDRLYEKVKVVSKNNKKIVVEFISKNSANKFFKRLAEDDSISKEVLLITGDDNKLEREKIISKVKSSKEYECILVATQVIEAGVDIDMDAGFKDISILDAEEQFLGRINRSCMKGDSIVYFFNMDKADQIYKEDLRKNINFTLLNEEIREILLSKIFPKYYDKINTEIEKQKNANNKYNFGKFINDSVGRLNFKEVKNTMKLIDDDRKDYTVFFTREIILKDGRVLKGEDVWEEYKNLLKDNTLEYAEKKVKLSIINENVSYFTYKVYRFENSYDDNIGDIFMISQYEQYFKNGKFDREAFDNREGHEII